MQCADPANCPNATSVDGLNIKAADYADCSFTGPDNDVPPLNPPTITAGTDINVRCQWDSVSLKYGAIQKWEQGMDGVTPTSDMMTDIRKNGYPNNTHIKTYPYSCLAGMGRQSAVKNHASTAFKWQG
jgi:hypothetical protein